MLATYAARVGIEPTVRWLTATSLTTWLPSNDLVSPSLVAGHSRSTGLPHSLAVPLTLGPVPSILAVLIGLLGFAH